MYIKTYALPYLSSLWSIVKTFFFKELEQYKAVDSAWTFIDRATFILNFGTTAYQLETFNKIIDLQASVCVQGDTDEEQQ